MSSIKKQISGQLKQALVELGVEGVEPLIEHPADASHGDYSTNIALAIFGKNKVLSSKYKGPLEFAKEIVNILNTKYLIPNTYSLVEAVEPGFINFWLSKDFLISQLQQPKKGEAFFGSGDHPRFANKEVMVEFTDPNPFKEFHIGHLYSNTVGESLSRLAQSQGARVYSANYQGDVGLHVAKAIWGLHGAEVFNVKLLGKAYAKGAKAYEEDEIAKQEITSLNKKIYEKDPKVFALWEKGRAVSLAYFEKIYKRLGTKFDYYYFESDEGQVGLELVKKHTGKVFEESEGAVIFPGKKYGLHNRVFINSLGLPTYEAKELGLASTKQKDVAYDLSVIVTGNEINEYFKVLLKALSLIFPDLAEKTLHIGHGMVRLADPSTGSGRGVKMSSRTGDVLTGEWLLDEAKSRIKKAFPEMDAQTLEMVAVGAVKYALLRSGLGRDIAFSFEESISLEGNSGPYLQYTYARTQSVLRKAKVSSIPTSPRLRGASKYQVSSINLAPEELTLLRTIYRFPEIVEEASVSFSPSTLCTYLFDLAQQFNLFYQKHKIIGSEQEQFRLALTQAVGQILKNGLALLGIKAPERM